MSDSHKHFTNEPPVEWDKRQLARQASFLQSSMWAAFQRRLGHRTHFISGDGWSCLLIERSTPLGRYLFAPYGPTMDSPERLAACLKVLGTAAKDAGADWLSLEPMLSGRGGIQLIGMLEESKARRAGHNREPDMTRIVDLAPPPDQLLAAISQSTRSFIRKNQREGMLTFRSSGNPKDIEIFTRMLGHVTSRKQVFFFPDEYFQKQAGLLMPLGMMRLELAMMDSRPVASALFHDFGEKTSYTYAASLPEARQTSASALLLWQAMLNAKSRGISQMDLFGIAPDDAPDSHPWQGFSSFKKKFGGEVVAYAGTWDIPLSPKYRLYRASRRARQLIR